MSQTDMLQPGSVTEVDLQAYIDGQLDEARRIEVEDFLARHPEAAAETMATLRTMDALRLNARLNAQAQEQPSERLLASAQRLEKGLTRQARGRTVLRFASLAASVAAGLFIFTAVTPFERHNQSAAATVAFVDEAIDAQRTQSLRQRLSPPSPAFRYDPAKLHSETKLTMPALPATWKVTDVQVYPWHEGYSVAVTANAGELGTVTLFAAPYESDVYQGLNTTVVGDVTATFWQSGGLAYALVGQASENELQEAAEVLLASLPSDTESVSAEVKTTEDAF